MKLRVVHLLPALGMALLLSGCKDGNIYATIETETLEQDLSLPNEIIVFDVAKIGPAYYAAAGKLWTVPVATLDTGGEWDAASRIPAPVADGMCTALVAAPAEFPLLHQNVLYGGFIRGSGNLGLFESSASPTPGTTTWTEVADIDVDNAQVALLATVDTDGGGTDTLVAVTATQPSAGADYEFSLLTSTDGVSFDPLAITRSAGEEVKPINDVIYAGATVNAWFATEGSSLYSGPLAGPLLRVAALDARITTGEVLYGLFWDGTYVYVSSWDATHEAECAVYYSSDGGTSWSRIKVPQADNGVYPPLTRFAGPLGTSGILLVGSDGYGYFQLDTTDLAGTSPLRRFGITTSDLYPAAVRKFALDSAKNRVFACTALSGLWRGAYDGTDGSLEWTQE